MQRGFTAGRRTCCAGTTAGSTRSTTVGGHRRAMCCCCTRSRDSQVGGEPVQSGHVSRKGGQDDRESEAHRSSAPISPRRATATIPTSISFAYQGKLIINYCWGNAGRYGAEYHRRGRVRRHGGAVPDRLVPGLVCRHRPEPAALDLPPAPERLRPRPVRDAGDGDGQFRQHERPRAAAQRRAARAASPSTPQARPIPG